MRKITQTIVSAFNAGNNKTTGNDSVQSVYNPATKQNETQLFLHGNLIAIKNSIGQLFITNAGWFSNTTKERLNALNGVHIQQKKGIWYLNGIEWDGKLIEIKDKTRLN